MKVCTKCMVEKDESEFYKSSKKRADGSIGLRSICKICTNNQAKKWAQKNPEKNRASALKCYYNHRDKYLERKKESYTEMSEDEKEEYLSIRRNYRKENREILSKKRKEKYDPVEASKRWKEYYQKHKEKEKSRKREYYYSLDEQGKQGVRNHVQTWRDKNPEKVRAHRDVERALKSGKLFRPLCCENCKSEKKLDAHHRDYTKTLEVVWLCRDCHAKEHF